MWIAFYPIKRKDVLERIAFSLPGKARVEAAAGGWVLKLRIRS